MKKLGGLDRRQPLHRVGDRWLITLREVCFGVISRPQSADTKGPLSCQCGPQRSSPSTKLYGVTSRYSVKLIVRKPNRGQHSLFCRNARAILQSSTRKTLENSISKLDFGALGWRPLWPRFQRVARSRQIIRYILNAKVLSESAVLCHGDLPARRLALSRARGAATHTSPFLIGPPLAPCRSSAATALASFGWPRWPSS